VDFFLLSCRNGVVANQYVFDALESIGYCCSNGIKRNFDKDGKALRCITVEKINFALGLSSDVGAVCQERLLPRVQRRYSSFNVCPRLVNYF
jgi:hypothetical protein